MKAARCAPALCGGKPDNLAADIASHRLNFLAARLNGTENPPNDRESGECRSIPRPARLYTLTGTVTGAEFPETDSERAGRCRSGRKERKRGLRWPCPAAVSGLPCSTPAHYG